MRPAMDLNELPEVLTPRDVEKFLGWKKDAVYSLFRSKSFPSEKVGSKYIIPKRRFLNWLGYKGQHERRDHTNENMLW
jgi:hypothetical protein